MNWLVNIFLTAVWIPWIWLWTARDDLSEIVTWSGIWTSWQLFYLKWSLHSRLLFFTALILHSDVLPQFALVVSLPEVVGKAGRIANHWIGNSQKVSSSIKAKLTYIWPVKTSLEANCPNTDGKGKGGSSLPNVLVEHWRKAHLDLQLPKLKILPVESELYLPVS